MKKALIIFQRNIPRSLLVVAVIVGFIMSGTMAMDGEPDQLRYKNIVNLPGNRDSILSVQAFRQVYTVFMNPACMNCHPAGDTPLQGEDSHLHSMGVQRGVDGKGVLALKCANCHQATNLPGPHMPPGNPNWHLPPADMKMIFQGRSPRELARQLLDTNENGHKTKEQLIEHVSTDHLVVGSWDHGEGHSVPPISHGDFVKYFRTWIEKGAYLPGR